MSHQSLGWCHLLHRFNTQLRSLRLVDMVSPFKKSRFLWELCFTVNLIVPLPNKAQHPLNVLHLWFVFFTRMWLSSRSQQSEVTFEKYGLHRVHKVAHFLVKPIYAIQDISGAPEIFNYTTFMIGNNNPFFFFFLKATNTMSSVTNMTCGALFS